MVDLGVQGGKLMSTCKDCLNYDVCKKLSGYTEDFITSCEKNFEKYGDAKEKCEYFKDRSKFIELPCKAGDLVYYFVNDNLSEYCEVSVAGFHIDKYRIAFEIEVSGRKFFVDTEFLGEKVFLTKEEAEQALAERGKK